MTKYANKNDHRSRYDPEDDSHEDEVDGNVPLFVKYHQSFSSRLDFLFGNKIENLHCLKHEPIE